MNFKSTLLIPLLVTALYACDKDEDTGSSSTPTPTDADVQGMLITADDDTLTFMMNDAEFIFACGLEGGTLDDAHWAIRGTEVNLGSETLDIAWLNIIMDDISIVNPPYSYSGSAQTGEGFNRVYRNGVEYTITKASYLIEEYMVLNSAFETYKAKVKGSYTVVIESPLGELETVTINFDPMIQSDYGGGC